MNHEQISAESSENPPVSRMDDGQFSELLTKLIRVGNALASAPTVHDFCRQAISSGLTELGFERISIWMVDNEHKLIHGTFGTSETGELRDERGKVHPWKDQMGELELIEKPQLIHKRHNAPLYNASDEVVGYGDFGAAALWNEQEVIGLLYMDNYLSQVPISEDRWRLFQLFASTIGHLLSLKQTESALRRNEELLGQILETMPVGVFVLADLKRIARYNRAAQDIWEFEAAKIDSWWPDGVWLHNGAAVKRHEWAGIQALEFGRSVLNQEVERVRLDGSRQVLLNSGVPLRDSSGTLAGAVVVNQDITESKTREEELEALALQRGLLYDEVMTQANRLERVMESVDFGLILINPQCRVVLANQHAQKELQKVAPLAVGEELHQIGGQRLGHFLTARGSQSRLQEFTAEGSIYEITTVPVGEGSAEEGWLILIHNVTHERAIQASIQQHQRLASVGQLAAGIAHDFNNIVAVIILYVQMIQRNTSLAPSEQARLNVIREQAHNASKLIRQILDFSRQTVIERQPTDLKVLVEESLSLWERTLPESILLRFEAKGDGPAWVLAEASTIQQALTNLAVNARDAMPTGGTLHVHLSPLRVDSVELAPAAGLHRGDWFEVRIIDTGSGIAPDDLPHIFDPFFTTKEVGKGTGLGLAQVYGIIQQHGGIVTAQSEIGKGTTIALYLPADRAGGPNMEEHETQEMAGSASGTILLVEDNGPAREATKALLEMIGYRVIGAADGRVALELFQRHQDSIQLVLTDLVMPEMGGMKLLREVRRLDSESRVLVMTGYPVAGESVLPAEQDAVEWLRKPFTIKELTEAVRRILL